MKNRILAACMALFAITTLYAYDFKYGDLCYNIIGKNEVEVTYEVYKSESNYSKLKNVVIANSATYNGKTYSVCGIGDCAFWDSGLSFVTIPNSVTYIGEYAFVGCKNLTSITIPDGVIGIGDYAFWGSGLSFATIPNSVTEIGKSAFSSADHIEYAGNATGAPWGARSMNGYVDGYFVYVDSTMTNLLVCGTNIIGEITIPNCVTSIGSSAFAGCSSLTSIIIPNSVTSIGSSAFAGCSGLTSIIIPNSVTSIEDFTFSNCHSLASISIPSSVTSIGSWAFGYCNSLIPITIPNSVASIGDNAFNGCSSLTSISIPNSVTSIGSSVFEDCKSLTSITIPNNITSIGSSTFRGCSGLTSITIPNSVTSIGSFAFSGCSRLASISIPNGVTSIGDYAFAGCSGLTSITIPKSVTNIGGSVFNGCNALNYVIWNARKCKGCNAYFQAPFYCASAITHFILGNEVESIPSYLCWGMRYLTSISIPNSVSSIGDYAFYGCSRLTSISIPSSVTSLGSFAFSGCSGLTSITIPSSVTSIGGTTFGGCSRLDTVIWNVKKHQVWSQYKDSPFYVENGESSISSFIFGNEVESVPDYLCYGLNKLTSVTIPNSVQAVGKNAFENCKYLEEVSFGTGIEEIGENAFAGDERIYSVTCYADVTPTIYKSTFSGVSSNAELHVLANLVKKYKVNEYWSKFTIVPISVDNTTNGTLTVRPSDTDATFTWPADSNADSYTLTIKKGDVVFCRLIFNGEGQLLSIAFAPARGETKHTPAASLSAEGYKFTVTGLDEASHYTYQIVVEDWENKVLNTYEGEFNTNGYTAIDGTTMQENGTDVRKVLRDGQVYIIRGDKPYTLTGSEVD